MINTLIRSNIALVIMITINILSNIAMIIIEGRRQKIANGTHSTRTKKKIIREIGEATLNWNNIECQHCGSKAAIKSSLVNNKFMCRIKCDKCQLKTANFNTYRAAKKEWDRLQSAGGKNE